MEGRCLGKGSLVQQVGAADKRALHPLLEPPCRDFGVVAAQKHGRHFAALPVSGFGVVWAVEEALDGWLVFVGLRGDCHVAEAVLLGALLVACRAGEEAGDGVDEHQCGEFAAAEDVVAD